MSAFSPLREPHCKCRVSHIIKTDLFAPEGEGYAGKIYLGPNMAGGEPQFVARDPIAMKAKKCAYDDGYLILYATHSDTMASYCLVRFLAPCASAISFSVLRMLICLF